MTHFSQPVQLRPLAALRVRLAAWYVLTLSATLLLLGGGLFLVVRRQISDQLTGSLVLATQALVRAAEIREAESLHARGRVVDAVDELFIPERRLFLLGADGAPIHPRAAEAWIREAAREAARRGAVTTEHEIEDDHRLRLHAVRFRLKSGKEQVAVAIADDVELEDRYAALITAFGAAAFGAVILVAMGGSLLVKKSTEPIERSVAYMRRFMADAAHELRTPLAVLRGRAEVTLQRSRPAWEYTTALVTIEREAARMSELVDNMLILARADSGELPVRREQLFLDDIAFDAVEAASVLAQRNAVRLALQNLDEAPVMGDPVLVRQLVMILLDNAVKFTPPGGQVDVRVTRGAERASLEVADTGIGIPPEHQSRVFERFFRGDPSRARGDGAGLGLSIAAWIARQHDAAIALRSTPGQGTSVTVSFPIGGDGVSPSPGRIS